MPANRWRRCCAPLCDFSKWAELTFWAASPPLSSVVVYRAPIYGKIGKHYDVIEHVTAAAMNAMFTNFTINVNHEVADCNTRRWLSVNNV